MVISSVFAIIGLFNYFFSLNPVKHDKSKLNPGAWYQECVLVSLILMIFTLWSAIHRDYWNIYQEITSSSLTVLKCHLLVQHFLFRAWLSTKTLIVKPFPTFLDLIPTDVKLNLKSQFKLQLARQFFDLYVFFEFLPLFSASKWTVVYAYSHLQDENDNPPEFSKPSYIVKIPENLNAGEFDAFSSCILA